MEHCAKDKSASSHCLTEVVIKERAEDCLSCPCSFPSLFADVLRQQRVQFSFVVFLRALRDFREHLEGIQSRLTCDSPDLPSEKGPNKPCDVSPEADADEVEVLQFATLFLSVEMGINQYSRP